MTEAPVKAVSAVSVTVRPAATLRLLMQSLQTAVWAISRSALAPCEERFPLKPQPSKKVAVGTPPGQPGWPSQLIHTWWWVSHAKPLPP